MLLREHVAKRLDSIAAARGCVTLLIGLAIVIGVFSALYVTFGDALPKGVGGVAMILGSALLLGLATHALDRLLWSKMVRCPKCGGSLWSIITPGIKARRTKVREDAAGCPHCGLGMDEPIE